jgi:3-dehydrosphinganine reductase
VNYFGTVNIARAVVPAMIERRAGSFVGVSSAAGLVGVFGYTAYAPTKFAVRGFLESLRGELLPYGIHVGCSFPPDTDTPQLADENRYKPKETHAIAGTIKPLSARQVAKSIVEGIEKERFAIVPDASTRALAKVAGLLPGVVAKVMDGKVRKAQAADS